VSNFDVEQLKRACPLPSLLQKIGLGEFARKSVRSPFRPDKRPSWGIFNREGKWFFKDQATGDSGDEITLLARWKGLEEKRNFPQLLKLYAELAGVSLNGDARLYSAAKSAAREAKPFSWSTCVAAFLPAEAEKFARWRGYSPEFCVWLRAENLIGLQTGNWALPVHGEAGAVIGTHYRVERRNGNKADWFYYPKGIQMRPLVLGDPGQAANCFVFESPWDAFTAMDKLGWHKPGGIPDTAVIITRGASNGKLVAGLLTPQTTVYAFKQNDETKNGKNAADEWLADVCAYAGCKVFQVVTPAQFKDVNDWTQAGATGADIMAAIQEAQKVFEPPAFEPVSRRGENVESDGGRPAAENGLDPFSTFSTGRFSLDQAIFPQNSWLARYMDFARLREESADSYLVGSILPVISAALARRVRFPWGEGWIYPNLYVMLAGKPGDRKSSAINLAEKIARMVLAKRIFLPDSLSVEALFDEYDEGRGGSPDKLLIADDANPFLGLLQKSNYGERVGDLLLRLFDCKWLAESFRRNKESKEGTPRRFIPETSTSIVFGATFNICQFQGHEIRSGLQRRFNYYLAERHGRFLAVPAKSDQMQLLAVTEVVAKLVSLEDTECQFASEAAELWESFQRENRRELNATNANRESQLARLNGQPVHVLKLAMIFQAALWGENSSKPFTGRIELATLQTAIEHSEHCVFAAQALDSIGNRAAIQADADVLLANIQSNFQEKARSGAIVLTRTDLTSAYAHHSGRTGAWKPDDLYLRLIPDLIRRGKAKEVQRPGKQSAFAFKVEDA
jgi:hypothetical protein